VSGRQTRGGLECLAGLGMANPCRVIGQTECWEQAKVSSSDVQQSLLRSVIGAEKAV
jgi:hypothetical protein